MFTPVTVSILALASVVSASGHGVNRNNHHNRALALRADGAEFSFYAAGL